MRILLTIFMGLMGLFCLSASVCYSYMTCIGYNGESFIRPAIQTGILAIFCIGNAIVANLEF